MKIEFWVLVLDNPEISLDLIESPVNKSMTSEDVIFGILGTFINIMNIECRFKSVLLGFINIKKKECNQKNGKREKDLINGSDLKHLSYAFPLFKESEKRENQKYNEYEDDCDFVWLGIY